jgi:hypothetical protein
MSYSCCDKTFEEVKSLIHQQSVYEMGEIIDLLVKCKENKRILDMEYNWIYFYISCIQLSVILFSTCATFVQGLGSKININQETEYLVSLLVTTYVSLTLSYSKFFKLDDNKESVHNLREKFAFLIGKFRFNLDKLKPWTNEERLNKDNYLIEYEKWVSIKDQTNKEWDSNIDLKKDLCAIFDSIIDSNKKNNYLECINREIEKKNKLHLEKDALMKTLDIEEVIDDVEKAKKKNRYNLMSSGYGVP